MIKMKDFLPKKILFILFTSVDKSVEISVEMCGGNSLLFLVFVDISFFLPLFFICITRLFSHFLFLFQHGVLWDFKDEDKGLFPFFTLPITTNTSFSII